MQLEELIKNKVVALLVANSNIICSVWPGWSRDCTTAAIPNEFKRYLTAFTKPFSP